MCRDLKPWSFTSWFNKRSAIAVEAASAAFNCDFLQC
jgi:hypothetical protein